MSEQGELKRVVKVGGSLLGLPDLPRRLGRWLARQQPATSLIVVGGGRLIDAIRAQQQAWGYADELAHELALRAMDLNARQVAAVSPQLELLQQWEPSLVVEVGRAAIVECGRWAAQEEGFERSWRTTSDSIAAEIAAQVGAGELVLLKSALPAAARDAGEYVDPLFARHLTRECTVRLVDLARKGFPECGWSG